MNILRPKLLIMICHAELSGRSEKNDVAGAADDEARKAHKGALDHEIGLTPFGHEQAKRTGLALRERYEPPDYIYHSGHLGTKQTMEGVLEAYSEGVRSRVEKRMDIFIRECDPGYASEMSKEEMDRTFPWFAEYQKKFGTFFSRPVGGQSMAEKTVECHLFLKMIFQRRAGQNVFVVTYESAIKCLRFLLEHWDYERASAWPPGQEPEHCGVTVYRSDLAGRHLSLEAYNQVFWKK